MKPRGGKWAGRILRFGHMGDVGIDELAALQQQTLRLTKILADKAQE